MCEVCLYFLLKIYLNFIYKAILLAYVSIVWTCIAYRSQKRSLDPQELKLQMVVGWDVDAENRRSAFSKSSQYSGSLVLPSNLLNVSARGGLDSWYLFSHFFSITLQWALLQLDSFSLLLLKVNISFLFWDYNEMTSFVTYFPLQTFPYIPFELMANLSCICP